MMKEELLEYMEEQDVKFIRLHFLDILGAPKNVAITVQQLERALESGVSFDASSIRGFADIAHSDLLLHPLTQTVRLLPWRPQNGRVARILCNITDTEGRAFEGDSRAVLQRVQRRVMEEGFQILVGPECEFFLFKTDENGNPTTEPFDRAGYFDVAPLDSGENVRREICLTLEEMGMEVESSHHESAHGQNEIDFKYSNALSAADDLITLKTVVKTVAQRNGVYASFMPKPLVEASGSGLHVNISLFKEGENLFEENGNLSETARRFLAGILKYAPEFAGVTNSAVNSYKRIGGGMGAPKSVSWGRQNRSALVRVPQTADGQLRLEFRGTDPLCNPYLAFAVIIEAGLNGIRDKLVLMPPLEDDAYQVESGQENVLPSNLKEAVERMRKSEFVKEVLGDYIFDFYCHYKEGEWDHYNQTVHPWEVSKYL